jgi:hypothetical protein
VKQEDLNMKKLFVLIALILSLLLPVVGACMGPIYIGAKTASWTAVSGATGYRVYYRAPGVTTWNDSQRIQTSSTSIDLVAAGVPVGSWEVCGTVFDTVSESGPSTVVPWSYTIKGTMTDFKIQ